MVGFLKIGEERRGGGKMKRGEGKKGYGFLRLWLERVNRSCYKEFFCSKFSLGFFFSKVFWGIVFLNNRDKKQWKNQKKNSRFGLHFFQSQFFQSQFFHSRNVFHCHQRQRYFCSRNCFFFDNRVCKGKWAYFF